MLPCFSIGRGILLPIGGRSKMVSHELQQHRLIGYARVSTGDQELSLQTDSLLKHGVKVCSTSA